MALITEYTLWYLQLSSPSAPIKEHPAINHQHSTPDMIINVHLRLRCLTEFQSKSGFQRFATSTGTCKKQWEPTRHRRQKSIRCRSKRIRGLFLWTSRELYSISYPWLRINAQKPATSPHFIFSLIRELSKAGFLSAAFRPQRSGEAGGSSGVGSRAEKCILLYNHISVRFRKLVGIWCLPRILGSASSDWMLGHVSLMPFDMLMASKNWDDRKKKKKICIYHYP